MKHIYTILFMLAATLATSSLLTGCQTLDEPQNNVPALGTGEADLSGTVPYLVGTINNFYVLYNGDKFYFLVSAKEDMSEAVEVSPEYEIGARFYAYLRDIDLLPATTYYYVFCGTDGNTEVRGEVKSFTTPDMPRLGTLTLTDWDGETIPLPAGYSPLGLSLYGEPESYPNLGVEVSGDGSWTLPAQIRPGTIWKAYAYAPYGDLYGNVLWIDTWMGQTYDYLYGVTALNGSGTQLDINFRHAMARVIFRISLDDSMPDDVMAFNWLEVGLGNILFTRACMDIRTGAFSGLEQVEGLRYSQEFEVRKGEEYEITLYSLPTRQGGTLPLYLYPANASTMTSELEADWRQGGTYEYEMVISRTSLDVEPQISIEPWQENDGGVIDVNH